MEYFVVEKGYVDFDFDAEESYRTHEEAVAARKKLAMANGKKLEDYTIWKME